MSPVTHQFPALGTTAVVVVTDREAATTARALVQAEVDAIDGACSRFRDDSDLTRVNRAEGRTTPVSKLFIEALDVALGAARTTGGLVDPTVGRALRVLGYDRSFADIDHRDQPLVVSVGPVPGWRSISVDRSRSCVRLPRGVELDLGATAKALCADRAATAAFVATGSGALVSLGGDISTAGPSPRGGWAVLVTDDHAAPVDGPGQRVAITEGGLATSGTAVRRWRRGGRDVHHLVDPTTQMPVDSAWRTVSVTAGSCVEANTASTAAMILGPSAPEWLTARGLAARLVAPDGAVTTVGGWPAG